jgi:hypothetical protein
MPGGLMTDTITESFCERCGTRYSLEPPARGRSVGIGRVRVLTRGLKNYVANDGMPMTEAMAAARQDEERSSVTRQIDAFHQAFNFCMTCRQYTCANCWNAKAGECLTCAPDLSREILPPAFPDIPLAGPELAAIEQPAPVEVTAWPRIDLDRGTQGGNGVPEAFPEPIAEATPAPPEAPEVVARLASFVAAEPSASPLEELTPDELAEVESALAAVHPDDMDASAGPAVAPAADFAVVEEAVVEAPTATTADAEVPSAAAPDAAPAPIPDLVAAAEATPATPEPSAPVAPADRAVAARRQTRNLLGRFRPGRATAPGQPPPTPSPAEPTAPAAAPALAAATAPAAPTSPAPIDTVEQPTWRITAPETTPVPPVSWPEAPAWPAPSQPASQVPGPTAAPWASRLATSRPETPASVWAASSQEVLGTPASPGGKAVPAIQACVSCGLSLSANARFCRRCGSRQG